MQTVVNSGVPATQFAFLPVVHQPVETPSWEQFLGDRDRLELLVFSGKEEYEPLIENLVADCKQLSRYSPVIYLIDFDVLRNYLELRDVGKLDTVAVDFIFAGSTQPYALPMGAYRELCEWLTKMFRVTRGAIENRGDISRVEFADQIAELLGVPPTHFRAYAEQRPQVFGKVMYWGSLAAQRLVKLLADTRFYGVVGDYDPEDAVQIETVLRETPRGGGDAPRSKKDERDAINLAIAFKNARECRRADRGGTTRSPGYMLVTHTLAVLNLYRHATWTWDAACGAQLCSLLRLPGQSVPAQYFPVIDPKRLMCAERIGAFDNPDTAVLSAQELRNQFRTVTDYLDAVLFQREAGLCLKTHVPVVKAEEKNAQAALGQIWAALNKPAARSLEQTRATAVSVEIARRRQLAVDIQTTDLLRQRSTQLLRLLGGAVASIRGPQRAAYRPRTTPVANGNGISRIEITFQHRGTSDILIQGTKLKPETPAEGCREYYYLRWPVACSELDFLIALREFLPRSKSVLPAPFSMHELSQSDARRFADEGLIVHTSFGLFCADLDAVCSQNAIDCLNISALGSWLRRKYAGRTAPEIQQYRVNTVLGDFCLDIVPPEGDERRFATVISNYNLSDYIALLYRETGYTRIEPSSLTEALQSSLAEFGNPPRVSV